jgi:hypothetical protein
MQVVRSGRGNCGTLNTAMLLREGDLEADWFATNIWHCQYLASQYLAKPKVANIWQLYVTLTTEIGMQPICSQHLAVAKIWHANFWQQTN